MPIDAPRIFQNAFISTGDDESHPAFMPGGTQLYYVKSTPDAWFPTVLETRFVDGGWKIPKAASFSGKYSDTTPFITHDGLHLYYASNRPAEDYEGATARDSMDLWVVDHATDTTWTTPRNLGAPVSGPANEWSPSLAADGTLYFASDRPGGHGGIDLWRSRFENGHYGPAENLGDSVNTAGDETEALVAPDQSWMIVTASGRADSHGGSDLYVSRRTAKGWSRLGNLGEMVNTVRDESSPHLTPDGEYFFWSSRRSFVGHAYDRALQYPELLAHLRSTGNGLGDLYQIDFSALGIRK